MKYLRPAAFFSLASVGLLALLTTSSPFAAAQAPVPEPSPQRGINVVGEGIVAVEPSIASVTLGVEVFNQSLEQAQAEARRRMDAVIQQLKAAGIPEEDIRTVSFEINPQFDAPREGGTSQVTGFRVQNLVRVKTRDIAGLGGLLDSVIAEGATRVFGIQFEAADPARLKEMARDQAVQQARARAEQLARAAGVSLGAPLYIEDTDIGGVEPVRLEGRGGAVGFAAESAPTPIQPGEIEVRSIVRILWAIQ